MAKPAPLISTGDLTREALAGQAAIVTGAGGGIGYEAARAMCWLGARVVIAEIDPRKGKQAATQLLAEFGSGLAAFVQTDVGDEGSIHRLERQALRAFGRVDIVINNATITPFGGVLELPIEDWDRSYRVNLRGPVLLARAFLPAMREQDRGVFACVSSVGGAYMGAYETFKTAQVELARTLDAELEGSQVIVFTIGPGIVRTATAQAGIEQLAPRYGKTTEEFFAMYQDHLISVEAAGAGFAAAVALAPRFRGLEISSRQALISAGIDPEGPGIAGPRGTSEPFSLTVGQIAQALALTRQVRAALAGQVEGWKKRSLFERQWMLRDFRNYAGMPADDWLDRLATLEQFLEEGVADQVAQLKPPIEQLARYFRHYQDLASSNVKDQKVLAEQMQIIGGWRESAEQLAALLAGSQGQ